ncbi:hypothetical protein AAL_01613 [Moelleriella libera RCEF 2490]|uniref:AB hydrolase-1 domain-containing protein n=1 Tax=Moelleriella libera RCEF 2490 TaxID=1081109 RepID=A0A166UAV4_9HYPO|nr:hypothetical protein AAL_01613 [Moelleriella libera RCEF 2490]
MRSSQAVRSTIKNAAKILYYDLLDEEPQKWEAKTIDQSYAVQQTSMTNEAFRFVASTYIVCENDHGFPPVYQETFGELAVSRIRRTSSGHSPMLSHTATLAAMMDETVRPAVQTRGIS